MDERENQNEPTFVEPTETPEDNTEARGNVEDAVEGRKEAEHELGEDRNRV